MRLALILLLLVVKAPAYSVLTHQAIIDAAWEASIRPVLVGRFPALGVEDLRKARAHAYGGSILHDMGYYPLGSRLFSDLVHYVKGGEFVRALIDEARDAQELAFALGALSHYEADIRGHSVAVNVVVPMLYPKYARRFGPVVTYEQAPAAHMKTEFAFDVVRVGQQKYASEAYHDFIGFEVSKPVLERAFLKTYKMELADVFFSVDMAIGTFRYAVSQVIPQMTKLAGVTKYTFSRSEFEREWGRGYQRPGWFARCMAVFIRILPRVGPLRAFSFRTPGPEAQSLFEQSFEATVRQYRTDLETLRAGAKIELSNTNLDTGKLSTRGSYKLADKAYERLLEKLSDRDPL